MSRVAPVELTTFVGRRRELAEGRRMLRAAPLVTLVGPGGVGKTRLAQRLAHQVERTFPDGVAWVELAAQHDPASVAGQVAATLGVDPQDQSVEEALTTYLESRRLLIVLDNCEHLVEPCARLAATLLGTTQDIRILATSRQPLGLPAEHVMNIDPLSVPTSAEAASGKVGHIDAVALLTDRARAHDPRFRIDADNAAAASRLCRRLDGIPLAIELAAARLRVLSLGQIVDRLDDRFDLLTTGSRTALPRHQTLLGLIEWSHDLCTPPEQTIWARMSVIEGGAELDAVEAVCAEPGSSTRELLDALVDKSIVTVTHSDDNRDRYRMLETIREYGAQRLAQRGETALVRDRHRDHFLALARRSRASWIGPHQQEWMARVTVDLGNLRDAFEHSLADQRDRTNALELTSSLVWYWPQAGATHEGSRWFAKALADPDEPSPFLVQGLVAAIAVASERGDQDTALPLARRATALPHTRHDAADDAAHHVAVATEALLTGDRAAAATAYAMAQARYQAAGDSLGQLECLATGANLANRLGHPEEGLSMVEQATRICEAQGERRWRAYFHYCRAGLLWDLGRPVEALAAARSSLESWTVLEPPAVGGALHIVARAYARNADARLGAVLFGVRERIRQDLGLQPGPFSGGPYETTKAEIVRAIGEDAFRAAHDEGFAMPLEEAVELALGHPSPASARASRTTPPETLSKRETQVAQLVAGGLSNKEIAEELVISPRTAEGHVAKVMDKLGAHSREEVAARFSGGAAAQE